MNIETTYQKWQSGEITSKTALQELTNQLVAVEDRLEPLQEQRNLIRAQLSELVEALGGKAELPGFGSLVNQSASITTSYDRKKMDALVAKLAQEHPEIAAEISECRTQSSRAGGLVIRRAKEEKE